MHQTPPASLSLDLDNKWSYMKTHGDAGWDSFPSYLDLLVPRILRFLEERKLTISVMIVGQDAALPKNREALGLLGASPHEIGNHSFHHEPWLHLYSADEIETEIARAEEHIERATGRRPVGFRGPGFSLSPALLATLSRRGYLYDASTLPTYLGPLARAYYFMTSRLSPEEKEKRKALFGGLKDGLRPIRPYQWRLADARLLEIPVTTMPFLKVPIHASYILYISSLLSPAVALAYFKGALALCRLTGTRPSILLHPLDFLGGDDEPSLAFFPAMRMPRERKLHILDRILRILGEEHRVISLAEHARELQKATPLPVHAP
jgi:hypothetical protein